MRKRLAERSLLHFVPLGYLAANELADFAVAGIWGEEWVQPVTISWRVDEHGEVADYTVSPGIDDYNLAHQYRQEACERILSALGAGRYAAYVKNASGEILRVPIAYWKAGCAWRTLLYSGVIEADVSELHGRSCFVEQVKFETWLVSISAPPSGGPPSAAGQSPESGNEESEGSWTISERACRSIPKERDAKVVNRIDKVLAAARRLCSDPGKAPHLRPFAEQVARECRESPDTVRQILRGTYDPMKRRKIPGYFSGRVN